MKELINITNNHQLNVNCVSARELYIGLGLDISNWSTWNKTNILSNEFFKQDIDFIELVTTTSGNPPKDFAISIDFAKHIAMQSKTVNSHKYRNYMITCEKEINQPLTRLELIKQQLVMEEENLALRQKLRDKLPDIIFAEHLDGSISMNALSKLISSNTKVDIGTNRLFAILRKRGILLGGRSIKEKNLPSQQFVHHFPITLFRSMYGTSYTTSVSEKGMEYVIKRIDGWIREESNLIEQWFAS